MGLIYAEIELVNFADETLCEDGYLSREEVRSIKISALADSGSIRLAINEKTRALLGLRLRGAMTASLADGVVKEFGIAGPIRVKFKQRDCITDAFVLPGNEEILLGAVPMGLMDLSLIPRTQTLDYNHVRPDGLEITIKNLCK